MSSPSSLLASACSGTDSDRSSKGMPIRRTLHMPDVGERTYHVYIPPSLCDTAVGVGADDENSTDHPMSDTVPLVFALHCLGCTAQTMMHLTSSIADPYSAVMVIPEGIQSSWNAGKYCCGYALSNQINDIGFLYEMATTLEADLNGLICRSAMYGVGWSNGGYMATYAAAMFRAIAPISGHIYNVEEDIAPPPKDFAATTKATRIFMHHSINDQFVQMTGCCTDPNMPHCCCGISESSPDTCTSAESVLHSWATTVNGCDSGGTTTTISMEDSNMGVSCQTIQGAGCEANSTICIHSTEGHFNNPSFEASFRMQDEVGAFFARDACSINGGTWNTAERSCDCGSGASGNGRYCLSTSNMGGGDAKDTSALGSLASAIILLALAATIAWPWTKRLRTGAYQKAKVERTRRNDVEMGPLVR